MADKGFSLSNLELQPRGLSLILPPFLEHKNHFSPEAATVTRKMAALRTTVEGCLVRVSHSRLLRYSLPVNGLSLASTIVKICAALSNFFEPFGK